MNRKRKLQQHDLARSIARILKLDEEADLKLRNLYFPGTDEHSGMRYSGQWSAKVRRRERVMTVRVASTTMIPRVFRLVAYSVLACASLAADAAAQERLADGEEERKAAVRKVIEDVHAAAERGDVDAVLGSFDIFGLLQENGLFGDASPDARSQLVAWLRPRFLEGLRLRRLGLTWERIEFRQIGFSGEGRRAAVMTRIVSETDVRTTRWDLVLLDGAWRVRDMLDVATGMSMHLGAGLAVAAPHDAGAEELLRRFRIVRQAHDELRGGDAEAANGLVRRLDVDGLPNAVRAARQLVLGGVEMHRDRPERALLHFERAASIEPAVPVTDYLRAVALNRLARHEEALPHARSFDRRMGGDAGARAQEAAALGGLGRTSEALTAARAGLVEDPGSVACLTELAVRLPAKGRRELTQRLAGLESPLDSAVWVLTELLERRAFAAAEAALAAIRKAAPGDAEGDFWAAELALARDRPAEAARLLARALPRAAEADREAFQMAYLEAMLALNEPLRAYATLKGSTQAFDHLAGALVERGDAVALADLVTMHRKYAPDDPWLGYFRGRALELDGRRDQAEATYEAASKNVADGRVRAAYREARVRNLQLDGKALEAYADVGPRQATFDQLAVAALVDADWELLTKLTQAHRVESAGDPALLFWEAEADALGGRYDAAVEKLRDGRDAIAESRVGTEVLLDRLVRYLARLGRHEQALVEARAATEREGDPRLEAIVHAWNSDAAELAEAIEAGLEFGRRVGDYYDDPDVGPRLRRREMASVRERFPDPR